jgi:FkbM family methyltransferase
MTLRTIPKTLALRLLPDGMLQFVKKMHYPRVLRRVTAFEEPDLQVLDYLVYEGQFAVDIGANVGVYSKYLSKRVGRSGRVLSVEPIPLTADILRSNLMKLRLENVEARNCAISDKDGEVRMQVPRYESGGEDFYRAHIVVAESPGTLRSIVVPSRTVDSLLSAVAKVHFIKCDVEGHELNCIRGAIGTIERSKPAWLLEISGDMAEAGSDAQQTYRILRSLGYTARWFDGAALRQWHPGVHSVNYFFLMASHIETITQRGLPVLPS